jgi:hypothetical protein
MHGGGKKGQKHTTGKICDGCSARRDQIPLRTVRLVEAGAQIVLTYCRRCELLDALAGRPGAEAERPAPTPREIVAARPKPPAVRLAPGWTTALPRWRATA